MCENDLEVSNQLHTDMLQDQIELFTELGLHFEVRSQGSAPLEPGLNDDWLGFGHAQP